MSLLRYEYKASSAPANITIPPEPHNQVKFFHTIATRDPSSECKPESGPDTNGRTDRTGYD
jgi:hypothetical protein